MVIMHGLFDLKTNYTSEQFKQAFDAFALHLKAVNLLVNWRYMQRTPHEVYDACPPQMDFYVAMEFSDSLQSEKCKDYVQQDIEPVKSLHRAVNRQVHNTQFFLTEDVEVENSN